jgi:hypothetical protein
MAGKVGGGQNYRLQDISAFAASRLWRTRRSLGDGGQLEKARIAL